ncbi:codanin-1 [Sorghum bicolor]|uniref:codanin-1 n=1 Tax=Sorghum bicolor TaxID=4558 RepID=UPI000B42383E|nr:codanin-1 [Sorghum bicolor]|eukprot:XP_021307235.1 codanin-1 [Sorghum bicolor]
MAQIAQNGRHRHRGCEAPPPPAPRPAAGAAAGRGGLRAARPAVTRSEEESPCLPSARVPGQRRGPARCRGRGGRRRDRVLAGELLHVAGAVRSLRAGAVVPHQALRQVQDGALLQPCCTWDYGSFCCYQTDMLKNDNENDKRGASLYGMLLVNSVVWRMSQ